MYARGDPQLSASEVVTGSLACAAAMHDSTGDGTAGCVKGGLEIAGGEPIPRLRFRWLC